MSQTTATRPEPFVSEGSSPPIITSGFQPGFTGLRCRNCDTPQETGPVFVCPRCFGPLEPVYDLPALRARLSRAELDARPADLWRFAELLPLDTLPTTAARVGYSPLVSVPRLAAAIGLERLWIKDDSRNPTLSFKDRVVAVATARAVEFGFTTLACASTGNLAPAVASAAAAHGLRAVVFVPADLEAAKVAQARALGATVVRVDGPYDAVNRLCLELTDELEGWAVVNVNMRPFYAEGSKTIAYEVTQQLGWRTPDVVVAPLASGSLYTKLAKGFDELAEVGLVDRAPIRFVGGQATGCGPIAAAFESRSEVVEPVERPETIVRSLAIGSPADGPYALKVARTSEGAILGVSDAETVDAIRLLAHTEGIFTETAGGVTLAALRRAVAEGHVDARDEVVLVITGNGLKTLDVLEDGTALPEPIAPSFDVFESWWEGQAA
ncbi:MAG: threonine synthase [Chloroflexi bacterium]|nr:threonine synthase [Chloroflexota bacterium]